MPLQALGHPNGNGIGGYGIPHPERLATIDGLYFLDHPRRAPENYISVLGRLFGEFLVVENNRTQERGLVARMEVPAGSQQFLLPYEPTPGWPPERKLAGILGDGPEAVLRVQWVPGYAAWGVAKHGRAGKTMVDRVAMARALGRLPGAERLLRDFFWECGPRDYDENRALYAALLDAQEPQDAYVRWNRAALNWAFEEVLTPTGFPSR